jgi:LacI family transcriptional regulator
MMKKGGIREIARQTGLSSGTVSLVLNGRGDALRIAQKTQERVWQAAKQLGYQPNIHARRLRKGTGNKDMALIALLWPSQYSPELLVRFFDGIREAMLEDGLPVEVVYKPYPYDNLASCDDVFHRNLFHGILVVGASDKDLAYLNDTPTITPVVLFNRQTARFSTVCADDRRTGELAAELLHQRGHKHVALVDGQMPMHHRVRRREGFLSRCASLGLSTPQESVITETPDSTGGEAAAKKLLALCPRPTAAFFSLGSMVQGAYREFEAAGFEVPRQMEIVGYADTVITHLLRPGLTIVDLPVQRIVRRLLQLLMARVNGQVQEPVCWFEDTPVVFRETLPDPSIHGLWQPPGKRQTSNRRLPKRTHGAMANEGAST